MTTIKTVTHYARNVHGQPNANSNGAGNRNNWDNPQLASSADGIVAPSGSITSYYNFNFPTVYKATAKAIANAVKEGMRFKKPWTLSAHDFNLDIPSCAYIRNITFTVRMKVDGNITVKAPYARFNFYNGKNIIPTWRLDDDGWDDGYYYHTPTNIKKLSSNWQDFTYVMSGDDFRTQQYPISELMEQRMGIDLRWYDASNTNKKDHMVSIQWVTCTIEYELPDPIITFDTATSEDNPRVVYSGEPYIVNVNYQNRSNAGCCNGLSRDIALDLPVNADIEVLNGDVHDVTVNNVTRKVWTVPCTPNANANLQLKIRDYSIGYRPIGLSNSDIGDYKYWVYSTPSALDTGEVKPYPDTYMQKGLISCVRFESMVMARDGTANFTINMDTAHNSAENIIWTVDDKTSDGVTLDLESLTDNTVNFNVPTDTAVRIVFKGCFIPTFTGESNVSVQLGNNTPVTAPYNCYDTPVFKVRNNPETLESDRSIAEIGLNPSTINFITHRVATSTELEAYVIDCGVADYDGNMIIDDCTLQANQWEKVNYIGMVPLKHSHYDPKSTYENKEIWNNYKNKTYAGKEGAIDEDISLQFRCPPKDTITLQGLVKLDKPTPINTNWKIWEGDPLNHRGWAVFSKLEIEKTNPLWYKCDATVRYITHDIYTKFQINKGDAVNSYSMPDMVMNRFELGANLSTALDVFTIDTDGGFLFDEDGEDGARNIFSLDEGQHLNIKTRDSLADVANIRFDWYSNRNDEYVENKLSRVFRILDNDGNSIFEYEYYDFSYDSSNYVTCNVVARTLTDVGWEVESPERIDLRTELTLDPIAEEGTSTEYTTVGSVESSDDEEEAEENWDYDDDIAEYIAPLVDMSNYDMSLLYGSSLEFKLNKGKLNVYDAGYNGREVALEGISLKNSEKYYFESEWVNNNNQGTTEDIISYIDVSLDETILNTQYSDVYKDIVVSPFPIPHKKIVFTRESQEGTLYYLTGDEPFKYLIEPYYQYYGGTDLTTAEGGSIFDLNNSHHKFFIENDLVRMSFNKRTGAITLGKYDIASKQYITTHYFHMSEDTIFSLAKYSDDKIVIKAGDDTYFTIWRGHPYIMVQNPTVDISIDSKFNYCLSDLVDGSPSAYPLIWSFMNTDNLLPVCLGGNKLDTDCIAVDDDNITSGTNHTISLTVPDNITAGAITTISSTLSPNTSDGEVHYILDGVLLEVVDSPFSFTHVFPTPKSVDEIHTLQAVYVGDDDDNIAISDIVTFKVNPPAVSEDSYVAQNQSPTLEGQYSLRLISAPKEFTYKDKQKVVLQLKRGQSPAEHMPIELQLPNGHTVTKYTNALGQVEYENYDTEYVPGDYQWGGRFYDNIDADHDGNVLLTALKWIKIKKATPYFTHSASNNVIRKGESVRFKLHGVEAVLTGKKITYTVTGGSKNTKVTNDNGNIHIAAPFKKTGTYTVKLMFAGSTRYEAITKEFTIKVV